MTDWRELFRCGNLVYDEPDGRTGAGS